MRGCLEGEPAVHVRTVYTPIGGKGRYITRHIPYVYHTSTLALKPMGNGHMKSKIKAISGPHIWTMVQQNVLKKER